jgi:hypothetical protein
VNEFFGARRPRSVDFHEPNYEEIEFLNRIKKIIDLIYLIEEKQTNLDSVISKDCQSDLKEIRTHY